MKIIGGQYKNRNFYVPAWIRPTQGMTRKAIFDLIGQDLTGLRFLDIFSGSGAVGLEALSRGAGHVTFVERDQKCLRVLEDNLRLLGLYRTFTETGRYAIAPMDAFAGLKHLARQKSAFDIVFLDPPYSRGLAKKSLKTLVDHDIIHSASLVIVEHSKREVLPQDLDGRFFIVRHRKYGISYLTVYQRQESGSSS